MTRVGFERVAESADDAPAATNTKTLSRSPASSFRSSIRYPIYLYGWIQVDRGKEDGHIRELRQKSLDF